MASAPDGGLPIAGLTPLNGILYGATFTGGANDYSALYSIDPASGRYKVLHDFANGTDGEYPAATLLVYGQFRYRSTQAGGAGSFGDIFKIRP